MSQLVAPTSEKLTTYLQEWDLRNKVHEIHLNQATLLLKAGLMPSSFISKNKDKTINKEVTAERYAQALDVCLELGIPIARAKKNFAIIRNQVCIYGDLVIEMIKNLPEVKSLEYIYDEEVEDHQYEDAGHKITVQKKTVKSVTIIAHTVNESNPQVTYTLSEAQQAGLAPTLFTQGKWFRKKPGHESWETDVPWCSYTKTMMTYKAINELRKWHFPQSATVPMAEDLQDIREEREEKNIQVLSSEVEVIEANNQLSDEEYNAGMEEAKKIGSEAVIKFLNDNWEEIPSNKKMEAQEILNQHATSGEEQAIQDVPPISLTRDEKNRIYKTGKENPDQLDILLDALKVDRDHEDVKDALARIKKKDA